MTHEERAAFINAQTALLRAETEGMVAENQHRVSHGLSIAYGSDEFDALTKRYEHLGYNALCVFFTE
jgi:hypothetical protein